LLCEENDQSALFRVFLNDSSTPGPHPLQVVALNDPFIDAEYSAYM